MTSPTFETLAKTTAAAFAGVLAWKWDGRFQAVVAQFDLSAQEKVRAVLGRHLGQSWDAQTVSTAPAPIKQACAAMGGLQNGQLAFASGTEAPFLYGAWWPWDNGRTVSLRLAARPAAGDDEAPSAFKECFVPPSAVEPVAARDQGNAKR